MRRKARVDANQSEIVKTFRQLGASVALTYMVGEGFPDIVVGWRGKNYLFEIKDGRKVPSERKLTKAEREFHDTWGGQIDVIETQEQVIEFLNHH